MPVNEMAQLFELYRRSRIEKITLSDSDSVGRFMANLAALFDADDWLFIANQSSEDCVKVVHSDAIHDCAKDALSDQLPLLFFSDEIALLPATQVKNIVSHCQFDLGPSGSNSTGLYSSFEVTDTFSLTLVFLRQAAADAYNSSDIEAFRPHCEFIQLFIKSYFVATQQNSLFDQLRQQVRRFNTWMEALNWINQTQIDETQAHSTRDFYQNALFQLSVLMHADQSALLKINPDEKSVASSLSHGELGDYSALYQQLVQSLVMPLPEGCRVLGFADLDCDAIDFDNLEPPFADLVIFPLLVEGKLHSLNCVIKQLGQFSPDDKVIGRLFSDGVEKIIERRFFIGSIKHQNKKLEAERKAQDTLIHELKVAKSKILENEKLASIGQLSAGVAHEINNPVGYVSSNISSLKDYLNDLMQLIEHYESLESLVPQDSSQLTAIRSLKKTIDLEFLKTDIAELISESLEGVGRVKKIVQDLKNFSHSGEMKWAYADLHQGLESTLNIVGNEIKYKSQVVKNYGDIPKIECVLQELNQVFMNLLVNAGHAIEKNGVITIETGMVDRDHVFISISDNGKGIEEKNLKKIFDPFFTTKEVGQGTGLGLSISYGIINKHGGQIDVESQAGAGTRFKIELPVRQVTTEALAQSATV